MRKVIVLSIVAGLLAVVSLSRIDVLAFQSPISPLPTPSGPNGPDIHIHEPGPAEVPEPATILLFGGGIAGMIVAWRKRRRGQG